MLHLCRDFKHFLQVLITSPTDLYPSAGVNFSPFVPTFADDAPHTTLSSPSTTNRPQTTVFDAPKPFLSSNAPTTSFLEPQINTQSAEDIVRMMISEEDHMIPRGIYNTYKTYK